jgi:hypothetical protein
MEIYRSGNGGKPSIDAGSLKRVNSYNVYPSTVVATATTGTAMNRNLIDNYEYFNVAQTSADTDFILLPDCPVGTVIQFYAISACKVKAGADASGLTINGGADTALVVLEAATLYNLEKVTSANWIFSAGTSATSTTGSGLAVLQNTPTLITPVLGVATVTSVNKVAITAPASSATLTIADGKTATVSNSITFAGTDSTVMTFPSTTGTVATLAASQTFTNKTLTSPTLTTPVFSGSPSGDGVTQWVEISISDAEAKALRAAPKTLVAAPGAGKLLEFVAIQLFFDYTAAYTESTANLTVKYTDGSGAAVSQAIEATGFADATADTVTNGLPKIDAIVAKSGSENKALVLHNIGAGEWGGGNASNAIRAKVAYRVWSTGF